MATTRKTTKTGKTTKTTAKTTTRRKRRSSTASGTTTIIPGITISWRKLLGIDKWSRQTGIPTTKAGLERKIGSWIVGMLTPGSKGKKSTKKTETEDYTKIR